MNDIDTLMQRIDEINSRNPPYTSEDIETVILYHRQQRARRAAGEKPIRPTVDLSAILGTATAKTTASNPFKGKKL